MRERRTVIIESSIYKEFSEIATKVKKDSISNQLEIAVKDYIRKQKGEEDEFVFSNILTPIDKRLSRLEKNLLNPLFKTRLDAGIILNLVLPLATDYIKRTDKDILQKVLGEVDEIYEAARKKTVRQLENKEGVSDAVC
ncbi:MAG: hypothetical protein ACM3KR_10345 [Deltaproteobacteria bacterium]